MKRYQLELSEDEAVVLFELLSRFADTEQFEFRHAAELNAFQRLSAQIEKTTAAMLDPAYQHLLAAARNRLADGLEGEIPGLSTDV